jgi:molybdate transport system ATP-binding protein
MSGGIEARFRVPFGSFTVDVDLALPGQGTIGLFGPSGCGKTTLLRCLAGLQREAVGRLVVDGECWQDDDRRIHLPTHRRPLGFVFQDANLFAHLDVRRNLAYGMRRVPAVQRRLSWDRVVELLGIGHLLDRMPARLSGGERQRVGIARALLASPRLLLLDEPLAALDHARKQEILPYLEHLRDEFALPIVYVSHSPDEMARLADYLVAMEAGRVVAHGPLVETLGRIDLPIHLGEDAGAVLDGAVAERDEQWQLARVDVDGGSLWVRDAGIPTGDRVRVRILARDVSIAVERHDSSIMNALPARVLEQTTDYHPAMALVRLQVGRDILLARVTRRSAAHLGLAEGAPVWAQIKAVAML